MPRLNANPAAEANVEFDVVQPGKYTMRVESIEEFTAQSGNTCWRLRASYTDSGSLSKLDGSPANNPGTVMDAGLVVNPPEKQGKVRSFVEACGREWSDLDSDELIGVEFEAKIGTETYQGNMKNTLARYLAPQV